MTSARNAARADGGNEIGRDREKNAVRDVRRSEGRMWRYSVKKSENVWGKWEVGFTWRRRRKTGRRANDWMAYSISENTAMSVWSRDARTTLAETAAFIDRTEVSLLSPHPVSKRHLCRVTKPDLPSLRLARTYVPRTRSNAGQYQGLRRVIRQQCVQDEQNS